MTTRCLIYARVSTDAQEREGTSLDTQADACRAYAEEHRWTIVDALSDTASGFTLDRPAIEQVRQLARTGSVDVVLAHALDRLSRKQTHVAILVEEMEEAGVALAFVTEEFEDTAVGQLIRSVKAFAAEFEREKIAERTMRGKLARAAAGKLPQGTGRGCFGYTYNRETGTREIEPAQAAVVRRVFESFVAGTSCNRIAQQLNGEGTRAFHGGRWYPLTVRRMLMNEAYSGRTVYRRTQVKRVKATGAEHASRRVVERDPSDWIEIPGATPPIISRDVFEDAGRRLADPTRRHRPSRHYPLRGRLRCRNCGTPMVGQTLGRGRYQYYRCRRSYGQDPSDRCASRYVPRPLLEGAVRSAITDLLANPRRVLQEARRIAKKDGSRDRLAAIEAALAGIEAQQGRLARLYAAGTLPEAALTPEAQRLNGERATLQAEHSTLSAQAEPRLDLQQVAEKMPEILAAIRRWVTNADGEDLELLLRAVDAQIAASRDAIEIHGTVPATTPDLVTIARTSA